MRIRNQKIVLLAMVAVIFLLIAACGSNFSKNTYRALAIQGNAYAAAMSAAGDLYKKGEISWKTFRRYMSPVRQEIDGLLLRGKFSGNKRLIGIKIMIELF